MAKPLTLPLPPGLFLSGDYVVRVAAIDPDTGDIVAGVNVSDVTLEVEQTAGTPEQLDVGAWAYVPGPGA